MRSRLAFVPLLLVLAVPSSAPAEKPRVLLLGDSISLGYTPYVQKLLADEAVVLRPKENCAGTTKGITKIDEWLALDGGKWDVVHFNFGLHDLKHVDGTGKNSNDPADPRQAEPDAYEKQLAEITKKITATGAKAIFATTTPYPDGVKPRRDPADAERYNAIARRIMKANGVAIDDLHAFVKPRLEKLQRPVNVHFTPEGSEALAGEVVKSIRTALKGDETSSTPSPRPNIVFVMVDDMGWADLGCFGGKAIATPNIDRMASGGMRFTRAYSGCTVCAPARSVLMTGRHVGRTSVRGNTGGIPLRDEDVTVAEVLKKVGYATGGFGKWGLGDLDTPGVPEKQGFDEFVGYYHQVHAHYFYPEYLIDTGKKLPLPGNVAFYFRKPGPGFFPTNVPNLTRQFSQYTIAERTKGFIREHAGEPFFCYVPWTPPHGRYEMPASDPAVAMYRDKPWSTKAKVIAAMDTMIDRQVGELLDLLRELEIDDRTYVFFCSDHGAAERMDGELDSCGPLRGKKRDMYEGGLRTPLIAWAPGRIAPGTESEHICYFGDMMTTFAELAGATEYLPSADELDSISIVPTLLDRNEQPTHDHLYWEWMKYDWGKQEYTGRMQAVRRGDWKLLRHDTGQAWELYDLATDEGEQTNLAKDRPEIVDRLARIAEDSHTEPRPQIEPEKPEGQRYR